MGRCRSIVSVLLAAIAVFVVGCSGASTAQPTTYSPDQVAAIQTYAPGVVELRDRFPELGDYVAQQDWVNIRSFIHGPMGELRARLGRVAARLLPQDAQQAQSLAAEIGNHLERLDAAAADFDPAESARQYQLAREDLNAFIALIPQEA